MERKMTKRKASLLILIIFIILWMITWIPVTRNISLSIPGKENLGVRIVLITDLHSCYYGKDQASLIKRIDKENPDIIFLSGDIFDDKLKDDNAKILLEDLVTKYPCFYVAGNHEFWSGRVDSMKEYLKDIGVHVLAGDCETVNVNGTLFDICGVDDPTYMTDQYFKEQIESAYADCEGSHVKILLSHRPEKTDIYDDYGFDLVLSGHAHAGQFKIPFVNLGVYAPDQGFFAKYIDGKYELPNGTILIVSRGLARESTPGPRFFNNPQIVTIDL